MRFAGIKPWPGFYIWPPLPAWKAFFSYRPGARVMRGIDSAPEVDRQTTQPPDTTSTAASSSATYTTRPRQPHRVESFFMWEKSSDDVDMPPTATTSTLSSAEGNSGELPQPQAQDVRAQAPQFQTACNLN